MLKTRIKTIIVLLIILAPFIIFSHIPYVFNSLIAIISVLGVYELYHVTGTIKNKIPYIISSVIALVLPFISIPYYKNILIIAFIIALAAFITLMLQFGKYSLDKWYKIFPISIMIPLFYSSVVEIRHLQYGLLYILLFALVCSMTDSGAYFVGKGLGKHKLAPHVSPKKTIEGSIGGTLSAIVIIMIIALITDFTTSLNINYPYLFIYILIASVIDQIGDLSMSVIKRVVGVKDYSNLMPGHGGILDRFDSYMFVAPFTYIFCFLIDKIIY